MTDDLVKRLRADELPGDRQRQIEARIELWKILQEAADRIENLEKALQFYAKATPDYLHGADWDWGCDEKRYGVVAREALEDK